MNITNILKACVFASALIATGSVNAEPVQPNSQIFEENKYLFKIPTRIDSQLTFENWETEGEVLISRFRFKSLDNGEAAGTIIRPLENGMFPVILTMYGLSHIPEYSRGPGINLVSQTRVVYVALDPPLHRSDRANGIGP
ncbi:MAG: hypothetical protein R3F50_08205 [Gammaproteobacteria bacterium]